MRFYKTDVEKINKWSSYKGKKCLFSDQLNLTGKLDWANFEILRAKFDSREIREFHG